MFAACGPLLQQFLLRVGRDQAVPTCLTSERDGMVRGIDAPDGARPRALLSTSINELYLFPKKCQRINLSPDRPTTKRTVIGLTSQSKSSLSAI
jgi:hypothetical protein